MDDRELSQLEAAQAASPDNPHLLGLLLKALLERRQYERGVPLVQAASAALQGGSAPREAAAELCLRANRPELALEIATGSEPALGLLRARALADLERRPEGLEEYRRALEQNVALEDPLLEKRLRADVVSLPSRAGRPALRVVSNDDTAQSEAARILSPPAEPITFADVGGLGEIKRAIHRKIILPYQKPSLFQRFRKRVGGGLLLYGPPGCGKTMLARATAGECKAAFLNVAISDVLDMFMGESERKLHALFQQARAKAPAVLFFDEVEALGSKRSHTREATSAKLVSQFLAEMDGYAQDNHGVLILAATNVPWAVDPAFRRPGRFDRVLFVPPPDRVAREYLLARLLEGRPVADDIDVAFLARATGSFSGADLKEVVETAADIAIEESIGAGKECPITDRHLKSALKEVRPTTAEWLTTARNYARYANEAGQYDEVLEFLAKHAKG